MELNYSVAVSDRSAQLGPMSDDSTKCSPLTVVSSAETLNSGFVKNGKARKGVDSEHWIRDEQEG